jgi:hypothetical protein
MENAAYGEDMLPVSRGFFGFIYIEIKNWQSETSLVSET